MSEKENKKTRAKNLTDAICRDLRRLDKAYFKPGDYPGLQFWVEPGGTKSWRFQYRVKGKRWQQRKKLGTYPTVSVVEAIKRAKIEADKIFKGEDPKEQIKSDLLKLQLGDAIRKYYQEELTTINQYRPSTIKGIKATFGPWIFRNTYEKDILLRTERVEDLQYKKLSSITPKMFKNLYQICGSRSPITANRLQEYLRKFWNDFVKADDNPFILDKKYKHTENIYLDYLDHIELPRVMKSLVRIDERSGRLNNSYYQECFLNPVSCLLLAFMLTTGRRPEEARSLTWTQFTQGGSARIDLIKTKTSKKNNKTRFNLGVDATSILNLISKDRLNNPESSFYYPIDDIRNKYIFPSKDYGRKLSNGKCKTPHVIDPAKTWASILSMSGVDRHMKLHSTRHSFATNFYRVTKDIKALADALGTTEAQALKYAKLVGETVVAGINKIKFFDDEKPVLKQVN
jgi:integrase